MYCVPFSSSVVRINQEQPGRKDSLPPCGWSLYMLIKPFCMDEEAEGQRWRVNGEEKRPSFQPPALGWAPSKTKLFLTLKPRSPWRLGHCSLHLYTVFHPWRQQVDRGDSTKKGGKMEAGPG